jgi:GTP-binding protein EngB required for normal cell division
MLTGRNIGVLGITSTGKSSMINALLGTKLAAVGTGETTKEITAYDGLDYRLYDFPGKNDDVSSFKKDYISLLKGLTYRMVLIGATVKEMSKLLRLLDALNLNYDIVINKFDSIEADEREAFLNQILGETLGGQFKGVRNVWCVSAQHPEQFPDWLQIVNYLTS